jgi:hypothetical protein
MQISDFRDTCFKTLGRTPLSGVLSPARRKEWIAPVVVVVGRPEEKEEEKNKECTASKRWEEREVVAPAAGGLDDEVMDDRGAVQRAWAVSKRRRTGNRDKEPTTKTTRYDSNNTMMRPDENMCAGYDDGSKAKTRSTGRRLLLRKFHRSTRQRCRNLGAQALKSPPTLLK